MNRINKLLVIECLRELSDRDTQRRLWLSAGEGDVSSLTEAFEGLFSDSGLGDALDKGLSGLGPAADESLVRLETAVRRVNRTVPREQQIDSPQMESVRRLAAAALELIEAPG